ncbi:MAG: histidine kinase dimerization/phospho-acceptor domain-containing protein [Alphaproteobacteria bacterium]
MKRILVIDESEMVRETLALILGRSFVVVKKPFGQGALSLDDAEPGVDLLILGITPAFAAEVSSLLTFAMQAPFAVLFLVDSKSAARAIENSERVACLTKPFNPYELKEKVGQLLARRPVFRDVLSPSRERREDKGDRYLAFPYLTRSAASLAHRFAASRLPLLISGEIGCGQDRVARALCAAQENVGPRLVLNGADLDGDYLAQKGLKFSLDPKSRESDITVVIENLDRMARAAQPLLLDFLEAGEERFERWRVIATTNADLSEKLYRGELLEGLYRKVAMLTLKLPPLRERRDDIEILAAWFARDYAKSLGFGEVSFSSAAVEQLKNYLWFGNLAEMEMVIARTLTIRRTPRIDGADIIFDFMDQEAIVDEAEIADQSPVPPEVKTELRLVSAHPATQGLSPTPLSDNGHAKSVELNAVIHELAHELKNPMVTIKTFAQLLGERYQDEHFRARFQDVVGHDIDRMDDLLETMVEFADFPRPRISLVSLEQKLRSALDEIGSECEKRDARFRWKGSGYSREIRVDEAQLKYVLKNVLLVILGQVKKGSEIEIEVQKQGSLIISYWRETARVASMAPYLTASKSSDEDVMPLRILLAKHVVERNGGRMVIDQSASEKDLVTMEFPIG